MRRFLLATTLFLTIFNSAKACDICGCATGNSIFGIIPQFTKGFMALHYQQQGFRHPTVNPNMNNGSTVMNDRFQMLELRGRHYLDKQTRWMLLYALPFRQNTREESQRTTEISGIGDISVAMNYAIINTGDSINVRWKNTLLLGAVTNLPTGKYMQRDQNKTMLPAEFQLGTGAWGIGPMLNYTTRLNNFGINVFSQYLLRGENELQYKFGNTFNSSVLAFYWINTAKAVLMPHAGVGYTRAGQDYQFEMVKEHTGGSITSINTGLDVYFYSYFANVFVNVPVMKDIPATQPVPQPVAGIRLGFFIKGNRNTPSAELNPSNFPPTEQ